MEIKWLAFIFVGVMFAGMGAIAVEKYSNGQVEVAKEKTLTACYQAQTAALNNHKEFMGNCSSGKK